MDYGLDAESPSHGEDHARYRSTKYQQDSGKRSQALRQIFVLLIRLQFRSLRFRCMTRRVI